MILTVEGLDKIKFIYHFEWLYIVLSILKDLNKYSMVSGPFLLSRLLYTKWIKQTT